MLATDVPMKRLVFSDQERSETFSTLEKFRELVVRNPRPKRRSMNEGSKRGGGSR